MCLERLVQDGGEKLHERVNCYELVFCTPGNQKFRSVFRILIHLESEFQQYTYQEGNLHNKLTGLMQRI